MWISVAVKLFLTASLSVVSRFWGLPFRHIYAGFTFCCPQGIRRIDCAAILVWQAERGRTEEAPAAINQNGSSSGDISLPPLRFCSRVLIFAFAAMELCWNRYDSLPVSTMWQ